MFSLGKVLSGEVLSGEVMPVEFLSIEVLSGSRNDEYFSNLNFV
jgi:hypothetical protein